MPKRELLAYFDKTRDPHENLAREEEIFNWVEEESLPELVRLWVNSECLVRGKAKSAKYGWYNEVLAQELKIPVVLRGTGGGVVFHDAGNLNWSLFLRTSGAFLSPIAAFDQGSKYVVKALWKLGAQAKFSPPNRIDVTGYKVSGMAAKSTVHTLLVHGTLLLDSDLEKLNRLCIPPPDCPPVANLTTWVKGIEAAKVFGALVDVLKESGFDVNVVDDLKWSLVGHGRAKTGPASAASMGIDGSKV